MPAVPVAKLRALLDGMEGFAREAPSSQQTRQKTAREMVGLFASDLAALCDAAEQESP